MVNVVPTGCFFSVSGLATDLGKLHNIRGAPQISSHEVVKSLVAWPWWLMYKIICVRNHMMPLHHQCRGIIWFLTQTRTPAFWDTPRRLMITLLGIHIRSQVKTRQSQSYKFLKIAKNAYFEILQETLHATHLLKLLDKMYKYEMDSTRTVGATERTRDAGRTDGPTDGRTNWNHTPPTTWLCRGYDNTRGWGITFPPSHESCKELDKCSETPHFIHYYSVDQPPSLYLVTIHHVGLL